MDFIGFKNKYEYKKVVENNNSALLKPEVSICVQTYQHANYIKECLDGILCQETNFDFEILLGEDHSYDGTRDICIDYAKRYPNKIRLFLHHRENNIKIGGQPTGRFNFLYNLYSAKGKYIAICEGDDYWTDPLKLQKQVDFLEENEEYVLCFTNCSTIDSSGQIKSPKHLDYSEDKSFSAKDLIFIPPTLTCVFKNEAFKPTPIFFEMNEAHGDMKLFIELLNKGKAKYLNFFSAHYRRHSGGIWSSADDLSKRKSRFEIAYYGLVVTNQENKFIFFREALIELSKLLRHGTKNHQLKLHKFNKGYRKYIDLNASHLFYFKLYLFFLKTPFLPNSIISRIQLRIIKERFQKQNSI